MKVKVDTALLDGVHIGTFEWPLPIGEPMKVEVRCEPGSGEVTFTAGSLVHQFVVNPEQYGPLPERGTVRPWTAPGLLTWQQWVTAYANRSLVRDAIAGLIPVGEYLALTTPPSRAVAAWMYLVEYLMRGDEGSPPPGAGT